jgi:hydrogenase maturation protein HypF
MTPSILALGAWLKNAACWWHTGRAHWSPLHGDLGNPEACAALERSARRLIAQARDAGAPVQAVAHDLHPDFFSTQLALTLAAELGVPAIGVQHHHAHLAAVLAEHGIDGPAVGLALDGVGLGTDGAAWGGELLWLDGPRWSRLGHLHPLALPGGDRAAREPWRMAASALHALGRADEIAPRLGALAGVAQAEGVRQMLARGLNCPPTTSMGRWFDAAAAALGLAPREQGEAEAALALEQAAGRALAPLSHEGRGESPFPAVVIDADNRLDPRPLLSALFDAEDVDQAAAGFHLALADGLSGWLIDAARHQQTRIACLGGGCFHNRILRERIIDRLTHAGLHVFLPPGRPKAKSGPFGGQRTTRSEEAWGPFLPGAMGCGDAGLAVGQAWVAARHFSSLVIPAQAGIQRPFVAHRATERLTLDAPPIPIPTFPLKGKEWNGAARKNKEPAPCA